MSAADPAAELVRMMRAALSAAGLQRKELDGSVYWTSGERASRPQRSGVSPDRDSWPGETPGHCGRDGRSPLLVLLHGTNDQAGTWARVVPMLVRQYRLIVPDLAGHGESEPKRGAIPVSLVVERLHRILQHENADDITLTGNSFGGWIAILYTLAHPQRVKRLVLESGGGLARPLGVPLVARDRETAMTILRAVWGPSHVPQEWVIDALLARATDSPMLRLADAMQHFVDGRLAQITAPTSLVWGADDGVLPLSYAEALQKGIGGARLHVIEGAAHIPHLQQPEKFVACLTATS